MMRNSMRAIVTAGVLAVVSVSIAFGAEPTTRPSRGKVVVLPFEQTNPDASQAWVGQSIRQGMVSDLMPYAPGRVEALDQRAGDEGAAIDAGRKAGAAYVVTGSIVTVRPQVRFEGQVLDIGSGKPVASLKATGRADDLFGMQNALADQLGTAIGLTMPNAAAAPVASAGPNAWGSADYLTANPYGSAYGGVEQGSAGSDFSNYGYGPYAWWPYLGPIYRTRGNRHSGQGHNHAGGYWDGSDAYGTANSIYGTPLGTLDFASIAGGGGNAALDGGLPYGLFIPTNRAQSRIYNAFGGSGTLNIARPAAPRAFAARAGGVRAETGRR